MRYVLKLEAIGDNHVAYLRHYERLLSPKTFGKKELDAYRFGNKQHVPWCALITGVKPNGNLEREFVNGQRDYRDANSTGSRGIFIYYALKPGLYEINSPETWRRISRYFAKVIDDSTLIEISREELMQCLKKDI